MLFRSAADKRLLLVLLVGETPKAGLNRVAFAAAVDLIQHVSAPGCGNAQALRIAGPSFSGSIPSLREALERLHGVQTVDVISSGGTNPANRSLIVDGLATPSVRYSAVLENDGRASEQFFSYVDRKLAYNSLAELAEGDSAFGEGVAKAARSGRAAPLILRFPMEISRLRNAYRSDPSLADLEKRGKPEETAQGIRLPFGGCA
jgi:hypothetical protein